MRYPKDQFALVTALILSFGMNLALTVRIHLLTHSAQQNIVGTALPPLRVKTVDGITHTLDMAHSQQTTIVYVFSPFCHWCAANLNNIKALSRAVASRSDVLLIGISPDRRGLPEYLSKVRFGFPVYTDLDPAVQKRLSLYSTPETLVVEKGVVNHDWTGAYVGDTSVSLAKMYGVQFPGLAAPPQERSAP